ncbi:hypothetical protein FRB96_009259 [Tulasnella sp. 330]|nr:hypothetical protein FRB96_009259 [Tulasnella sp. 330]
MMISKVRIIQIHTSRSRGLYEILALIVIFSQSVRKYQRWVVRCYKVAVEICVSYPSSLSKRNIMPPKKRNHAAAASSTSDPSKKHVCVTSADGQTGHLIAELLLTDEDYASKIGSLTLIAAHPHKCDDLKDIKMEDSEAEVPPVNVVTHHPGKVYELVSALKHAKTDVIFLIPPSSKDRLKLTREMIRATRDAGVKCVVLLSAAGADLAEKEKQPHLREFIDIEQLVLQTKGDLETEAGHSPCVIRAGFYAENLLLYNKQAQSTGKLPLPIGKDHKFAPVALGDVAQIAAMVITGEGPHGLDDNHRGQLITITGPTLCAGEELATAARDALNVKMEFEDITEEEAREILKAAEIDEAEKEYILEYYSLIKEGKTSYVSTHSFQLMMGQKPMQPTEFFQTYDEEFKPKSSPGKVINDLFVERAEHSGDDFPNVVATHFEQLFKDEDAFNEIQVLSVDSPPESIPSGSLVRFRGMVQATLSNDVYVLTFEHGDATRLGGWGLADKLEFYDGEIDHRDSNFKDRCSYWAVSVPGESAFIREALDGARPTSGTQDLGNSAGQATSSKEAIKSRPHKFPTASEHVGVQIKTYTKNTFAFKPTEIVTFVGLFVIDGLGPPSIEDDEGKGPDLVPTINVIFTRQHPKTIAPFVYPLRLSTPSDEVYQASGHQSNSDSVSNDRAELVAWVAEEALGGDQLAAEWALIVAVARVYSRHPEILPPALTISSFPPPPKGAMTRPKPTLAHVLELMLPVTVFLDLPKNLSAWSEDAQAGPMSGSLNAEQQPKPTPHPIHFAPRSVDEDLHSGVLQLPPRTVLTILEAGVEEGMLSSQAVENLQTLRSVIRTQVLHYKYPFSAGRGFEFHTEFPCIVLCEGGKSGESLFLPDNEIILPLRAKTIDLGQTNDPYKSASDIKLPPAEKLDAFRRLICGALVGDAKVTQTVGKTLSDPKYIQADFVKERSESASKLSPITPDDLRLRMNVARLLALTYHESEVTEDIWNKMKTIEEARRSRLIAAVAE